MGDSAADRDARRTALATTLRAVRLHRGMGVSEMAEAMHMPVRSYQHFESGRSRLNVDQMFEFATATRSDPMALLAAVLLGAPELAVRSADNKLVSALMMNLDAFNNRVGDPMRRLRANTILKAFGQAFDTLADEADQPDPTAAWIAQQLGSPPTEGDEGSD